VAARVALAANEAVWFLEPDHHISLQVGSWISREPHGLDGADQIAERVRSEARGVGSYRAMRIDYGSLVRRDVAWKHRQVGGDRWIVRFERERALSDLPAEPWSGKWIGAYSMPDDISGEARAAPAGGPLSALVLEDGSRCAIHLVSAVWQFTAVGNIRSHHLAASFPHRTPYASHVISAQLDPEKRELRGGLQFSSAPGRVRKGAFYLRHLETDR
jgi:hypothetical protein